MLKSGWGKRRRLLNNLIRRLRLANLVLLAGLLAACNQAGASEISTEVKTPVATNPTEAIKTQTPTTFRSPSPTPTETEVPIVYTDPVPYMELLTDPQRKELVEYFDGGYFVGSEPNVENIEDYLMVDFSHEGKLRILTGKDLNDSSWGLYVKKSQKEKSNREIMKADGEGVTYIILYMVAINGRKDLQVQWGDLVQGTSIFVSKSTIDFVIERFDLDKDFLNKLFPFDDPRFSCEEVESLPVGDSVTVNGAGTNCEYIGK